MYYSNSRKIMMFMQKRKHSVTDKSVPSAHENGVFGGFSLRRFLSASEGTAVKRRHQDSAISCFRFISLFHLVNFMN